MKINPGMFRSAHLGPIESRFIDNEARKLGARALKVASSHPEIATTLLVGAAIRILSEFANLDRQNAAAYCAEALAFGYAESDPFAATSLLAKLAQKSALIACDGDPLAGRELLNRFFSVEFGEFKGT